VDGGFVGYFAAGDVLAAAPLSGFSSCRELDCSVGNLGIPASRSSRAAHSMASTTMRFWCGFLGIFIVFLA
jgi:hypothetical protein